ncbi:MAG: cell division protein SepF [Candidatus Baldrarchaeia archaeon]
MPLFSIRRKKAENEKMIEGEEAINILKALEKSVIDDMESSNELNQLEEMCEIYIRFLRVSSLADIQKVDQELERGNILILDMYDILGSPSEAKRSVEQLRAICRYKEAEMRSLGNRYIIIAPYFVKIVS